MVTVFLFSGRQNPQWMLTDEQAAVWIQQWEETLPAKHTEQAHPKLGYNGCRVQKNKHSYWIINNSCVSFYNNNEVTSKSDPGRKMELFLLRTSGPETKELLIEMKVLAE